MWEKEPVLCESMCGSTGSHSERCIASAPGDLLGYRLPLDGEWTGWKTSHICEFSEFTYVIGRASRFGLSTQWIQGRYRIITTNTDKHCWRLDLDIHHMHKNISGSNLAVQKPIWKQWYQRGITWANVHTKHCCCLIIGFNNTNVWFWSVSSVETMEWAERRGAKWS